MFSRSHLGNKIAVLFALMVTTLLVVPAVATAAVPVNTSPPAIDGDATEGGYLYVIDDGTWTNSPTDYSYQWQRCNSGGASCSNIGGEIYDDYYPGSIDVGKTVRVVVTTTNASGSSVGAPSAVSPVIAAQVAPANTGLPSIYGDEEVGGWLEVDEGLWTGPPDNFAYQWQRCNSIGTGCVDIGGATDFYYDIIAGDLGKTIRIAVTAVNVHGSATAYSAPSAVVAPAPVPLANATLPAIIGNSVVGSTLTVTDGTWKGDPPTYYSYQWLRCDLAGNSCIALVGSTQKTYVVSPDDVGHTLRVLLDVENNNDYVEVMSSSSGAVANASPPPPPARCFVASKYDAVTKLGKIKIKLALKLSADAKILYITVTSRPRTRGLMVSYILNNKQLGAPMKAPVRYALQSGSVTSDGALIVKVKKGKKKAKASVVIKTIGCG